MALVGTAEHWHRFCRYSRVSSNKCTCVHFSPTSSEPMRARHHLFAYKFIIFQSFAFNLFVAETAHDHPNGIMMLNLSLKCVVSITFVVIVSSTAELVPSHLRASLLMSCTIWGRICLLTASFIGSLSLFTTLLPLAVFAINMTIAGFLMCAINPNVTNHQMMTAATKTIEFHEVEKLTSPTRWQ